jgi:hypothetical protein
MSSPSRETTPTDAEVQERLRVNNVLETMMGDVAEDEEGSDNEDVRLEWLLNAADSAEDAEMEEIWVDDEGGRGGDPEFYDDAEYFEEDE